MKIPVYIFTGFTDIKLLDSIELNCSQITNIFLQDSISSMMDNIATTKTKIQVVKVENAGK